MNAFEAGLKPDPLLVENRALFKPGEPPGPILDLACGEGHNGIYMAGMGFQVTLCDVSADALQRAGRLARRLGLKVDLWRADLEAEGCNPLHEQSYAGIMVFRYLHRPLFPAIRRGLKAGGLLLYKTYTVDQARYGRPHNPDFLLQVGELLAWFDGWEVIHYWEGVRPDPMQALAELVCRRPSGGQRAAGEKQLQAGAKA